MKHYVDITLLPDAEANLGFLWQKVYQQIHIALAENKIADDRSAISLSIPKYGDKAFPLGNQIRLIATEAQLTKLDITKWLNRLTDYVHIKSVKAVPDTVSQFACFKRKHIKGSKRLEKSLESKARHQVKKFEVDYDECLTALKKRHCVDNSPPPFISLQSLSSDKNMTLLEQAKFPLFITMEMHNAEVQGEFNCYGLSSLDVAKTATVPWFE
jgi:CRISPR-associated endonuclease Csy4